MAVQALYRKWRSQTFDEVVGQEHVTLTLYNALREGRLSHAYLFTGPRGTGKTSTARILAKAINCLAEDPAARPCNQCRICTAISEGRLLDLIEIDAASNRGIDEIRDLREKIGFRPNEARYKVYIIDEVHMLTKEAFNALLKTLEEPPPHAVFVLATTEPDRVPETVRSRCQRFDFRRIPTHEIVSHLTEMLKAEGGHADPEALVAIARRSTGCMRDAISLLDQLLSYGDEVLTVGRVEGVLGLVSAQSIGQLVDHMAARDAAAGLTLLNQLVAEGVELGQLVDQIVAYLRGVLFARVVAAPQLLDLPQDVVALMTRQAKLLSPQAILAALREFTDARAALKDQIPGVPQLPIEVAFLRATFGPTASSVAPAAEPAAMVSAPAGSAAPTSRAAVAVAPAAAPVQKETPPPVATTPAPVPELERSSTATGAPGEVELRELVQAGWDKFLALAGKRCGVKVQAALRGVREIEVQGQVIVFLFQPSQGFSRDVVNQHENRVQVENVLGEQLGRLMQIRCALLGEAASAAGDSGTPARSGRKTPPQATPGAASATDAAGTGDSDETLLEDARKRGAVVTPLKNEGKRG
jgi:DNA polymerase III subunit gamma/tau